MSIPDEEMGKVLRAGAGVLVEQLSVERDRVAGLTRVVHDQTNTIIRLRGERDAWRAAASKQVSEEVRAVILGLRTAKR